MKPSDRYVKIIEWSEDDGCYVGTCPGLMLGGVHGNDEAKVYKELCQAVEECIQICQEEGDPLPEPTAGKDYSGKFVVRVGSDLHKQLAIAAYRSGKSLNSFCLDVLRERGPGYHAESAAARRDANGKDKGKPASSRRRLHPTSFVSADRLTASKAPHAPRGAPRGCPQRRGYRAAR